MRTSSHPLPSLGVVLSFAAALALAGCGKGGAAGKPTPPPPAVTVEAVASGPFRSLLAVTGTVEPTVIAGLASPAEGPVVDCRVREGDRVTAGQELLRIGRQLSAEAAQASAREELRRHRGYEVLRSLARHPWKVSLVDCTGERREVRAGTLLAAAATYSRLLRREVPERRVGIVLPPGL